ncbi:hypothetical protein VQ056_02750 [Paenibacillus sp. JTLBN-2024]
MIHTTAAYSNINVVFPTGMASSSLYFRSLSLDKPDSKDKYRAAAAVPFKRTPRDRA